MSKTGLEGLSGFSMLELFRMEVESQCTILTAGLLKWEQGQDVPQHLKELMRAAHSLKGAARIVGRKAAVRIAHAMEDCFVAAQAGTRIPSQRLTNALLAGIDVLNRVAHVTDEALTKWEADHQKEIENLLASILSSESATTNSGPVSISSSSQNEPALWADKPAAPSITLSAPGPTEDGKAPTIQSDRVVRVTSDNLGRLMGLAGEALVTSRWLDTFGADMLRLKRLQHQVSQGLEALRDSLPPAYLNDQTVGRLNELRSLAADAQRSTVERLADFDLFDRRFVGLSTRLYHAVLDCRMRPFSDGIQGFHRMVRDVAHGLGKSVTLVVEGETTPVDRDILEKLKAPVSHLLRNAIDHGIESASARQACGKAPQGTVRLQACHHAGTLLITVSDDGSGVDPEAVREVVVQRKLTTAEATQGMTEPELFEFLFLPGFTLKESVSEISGRGVGLDVVQTMVKEVGGRVSISSQNGRGTSFQLELPLTLSVARTLLVEIAGEPFAFPLARVDKALKLEKERIQILQGRQHFTLGEEQIGLVAAHQVLELQGSPPSGGDVSIVVLGDKGKRYGLVVDRFLGERELVVRCLDPRLGKVKDISSAALMPDGSPVLIVDVDDLKHSIEHLVSGQHLLQVGVQEVAETVSKRKRVLVVDDSLTVRELERKLLGSRGYAVDIAVDGMDGWNAVRTGNYDLIVTDVDMPRLDGIELLKLIRNDSARKSLPVIIVSYKDRQEDRRRGLEAGADYYLTKASFHDETLLQVVADLIGAGGS